MLRNIGIVAHINAGKTTLTERILFDSGKQRFLGDVESGTATMDWMVEEQRRGISITAAVTSVDWRGARVQLIDTPGHVDFTVEVERCLRVLDGVVVLLDGIRGVESQTEAVWSRAREHRLPAIVFVNKLDRPNTDFDASLESARRAFGSSVVEVVRPLRATDGSWIGLLDLVEGRVAWCDQNVDPAELPSADAIANARQDLIAACAEFDEQILARFVDGLEVDAAVLRAALRRATLTGEVVPALGGSALLDAGVDMLLDAVRDYLPAPDERGGDRGGGEQEGSLAALLFKVHIGDDGVETLGFLRVFQGELRAGDRVEIASSSTPILVPELWRMHSMERETVASAGPGEFVAVALPMPLRTGETLREPGSDVVLEEMRFPEPVLTMSLEPRTSEGRAELEARARAMAFEDPTLVVRREHESAEEPGGGGGRLFVSGMGELHLEVFGSRLNRRLAEPARFGRPHVARYETVAERAGDDASLTRRFGGEVEIEASVAVEVEPARAPNAAEDDGVGGGGGCEVVAALGRPADRTCLAVCSGLRTALRTGVVGAHPARGVRVEVRRLELRTAGAADPEDLCAVATEAAVVATRRAMAAAGRVVLEPDVDLVVRGPSESFGSVLADLRSRGAEIRSVVPEFGVTEARGRVRLAAVVDYASALRSMTQGKASVRFELGRFVRVEA